MKRPVIAILASGEGTTAEAFIKVSAEGAIEPTVGLVIVNNKSAGILKRVERLNKQYGLQIKTANISGLTHPAATGEKLQPGQQTVAEEKAILELLQHGHYDLIVLMGYMKKMGPSLIKEYGWEPTTEPTTAMMLNTHPGLLPATKGLYGIYVQEHVIQQKHSHGGQTLHAVSKEYDEGPVIASHQTPVLPNDTPEELFERVKILEKQHLPHDVAAFIKQKEGR